MRNLLFFSLLFFVIACKPTGTVSSDVDVTGYESINLQGGGKMLSKSNDSGLITELGFINNGNKEGAWYTYHPNGQIKSITNYVSGVINGPVMEFSNRGQLEKQTGYLNNQLHGVKAEYKFGRPTVESNYTNGQLDGVHKEYFNNSDKVQKLVNFKNGKQDGIMQYFDEEGNVTLEYVYKNGEKVSGGIKE